MIVREIKKEPLKTVGNFDWFNDYKDTRDWVYFNCPRDVLTLLDAAEAVYDRQRRERETIRVNRECGL